MPIKEHALQNEVNNIELKSWYMYYYSVYIIYYVAGILKLLMYGTYGLAYELELVDTPANKVYSIYGWD